MYAELMIEVQRLLENTTIVVTGFNITSHVKAEERQIYHGKEMTQNDSDNLIQTSLGILNLRILDVICELLVS